MEPVYLSETVARDVAHLLHSTLPRDGLTAFDLLQLPESADAATFSPAAEQLARKLAALRARYEQEGRADFVARVKPIEAVVAQVAASLTSDEQLDVYREALSQERLRRYRAVVDPLLTRGRKPTDEERQHYRSVATELRLDTKVADAVVQELAGVRVTDTKYTRLGLVEVAADPAWPTAFDLLELSEEVSDRQLIAAQQASQRQKLEPLLKSPNMNDQRLARQLVEEVDAAAAALSDPAQRQALVRDAQNQRLARLREEVRLAPQPIREDQVVRLLDVGESLRLPENQVRAEITAQTGFGDYLALLGADRPPRLGNVPALSFTVTSALSIAQTTQELRLPNAGGGILEGRLVSRSPWIRVETPQFETSDVATATIRIDAGQLRPGLTTTGLVQVSSNGGEQLVNVQARLVDLGVARTTGDRLGALLAYATAFTGFGPLLVLFIGERRSSYVAAQAAQASVLGWLLMLISCVGVMFSSCCGIKSLGSVGDVLFWVIIGTSVLLAILSAIGLRIRVPYLWDYALKFVRVKDDSGPTTMRAGSR